MLMMAIDTIEEIDYDIEVGNQGKNEEEEILTIGNARQLVPTFVEIPLLRTGYIFSSFSGLVIFNMQHGLARRSEEMSRMLSICRYDQIINGSIIDHFGRFGHVSLILTLHLFSPDPCGIAFPFDPGSHLLNVSLGVPRNFVCCIASGDVDHDKVIISTLWNSCIWVDTRQEQNLHFVLYKPRELGREQKIQGLLVTGTALYLRAVSQYSGQQR